MIQDPISYLNPTCSTSPPLHRRRLSEEPSTTSPDSVLTTTLFLGDLPFLCTETSLRELFSRYGEIERLQLKKSARDPQRAHLGFGFVKFTSRASAERALLELNGHFFLGRALRVGWADDYNRICAATKATDPKKNHQTAQLHVSFHTHDPSKIVSEMDLREVFGGFGHVVDIAIKKNVLKRGSCTQSGYAFVHFSLTLAGVEAALAAAERVNNCEFDRITYKCKSDQALLMQYMSLKSSDFKRNRFNSDMRAPLSQTNPESHRRPISYPLKFSTYENAAANPQVGHFAPSLLDDLPSDENRETILPFPRDPLKVSYYHHDTRARAKELQGLRKWVMMNL